MGTDYYSVLGLPQDATAEEIRSAYFDSARKLHPDANPDPDAQAQFLAVQEAYDTLSNENKRKKYDKGLPLRDLVPDISIKAKYSRSGIPLLAEKQIVYGLLDINCSAKFDPSHYPPISLCLVIDRSTSMNGARMDMVKANAVNLIRQLRPDDMISIVAFSDRSETIIPPTRVGDISRFEAKIQGILVSGATEIYKGLESGVSLLKTGSILTAIKQLILITDGHTYGDEKDCYELAKKCAEDGITIHALGVGHEWNDDLLDKVSSLSGGNANFIASPKDLFTFIDQRLSAIVRVYARNVIFEYECDEGVELTYAFRLSPDITPIPIDAPINLGNVCYDTNLSVLLEFMVQPISPKTERLHLSKGRIKMEIPSKSMPAARLFVDLKRDIVQNLEKESAPISIVEAMARLTLYRMQDNARKEVEDGEIDRATEHLHHLATHLLAQGNRDLAHTVLMEAEHIQQSRRFSQEGDKRIKYGTRSLLLLPGPEQNKP